MPLALLTDEDDVHKPHRTQTRIFISCWPISFDWTELAVASLAIIIELSH